ncbi:MAG: DUF4956 domain-containing protein [Anaerolineaceae bacterium]|nr:DUF4956 domain-containing protein [Anaerolineaceae bacterium]
MDNIGSLTLALFIDLVVSCIIVLGIYFPTEKDKGYVLTFFAFNISIFLIATLFSQVEISLGLGFGLFAIFSILRYRSDPLPVREMTYLFILMTLPVIDVIMLNEDMIIETIVANLAILAVFFVIEKTMGLRYEVRKSITYEKIELIKPEHYESLLADLRERTGLPIKRAEIGKIDFLHDVADIKIYYQSNNTKSVLASRKE